MAPSHPPLTGDQGEAAVEGQLLSYPQVTRGNKDYPLSQQVIGLVSFMLFKEPKKLKTGQSVYGFLKLRGNYSDADMAKAKAADIIRVQDSKNKIKLVEVGGWVPITEEEQMVKEVVDVKLEENEQDKLREAAIVEEKNKRDQVMRELREREEEVKNGRDYNDDPQSLDFYTMKKVAWLRLSENIELEKKKITSLEEKLKITRGILAGLDVSHPEYNHEWINNYNIERRKSGIPDYRPSEKEDQQYLETKPVA